MTNLTGQTALITGGASGVGHAMASAFAAAGAHPHVVDVSKGALDACPAAWGEILLRRHERERNQSAICRIGRGSHPLRQRRYLRPRPRRLRT